MLSEAGDAAVSSVDDALWAAIPLAGVNARQLFEQQIAKENRSDKQTTWGPGNLMRIPLKPWEGLWRRSDQFPPGDAWKRLGQRRRAVLRCRRNEKEPVLLGSGGGDRRFREPGPILYYVRDGVTGADWSTIIANHRAPGKSNWLRDAAATIFASSSFQAVKNEIGEMLKSLQKGGALVLVSEPRSMPGCRPELAKTTRSWPPTLSGQHPGSQRWCGGSHTRDAKLPCYPPRAEPSKFTDYMRLPETYSTRLFSLSYLISSDMVPPGRCLGTKVSGIPPPLQPIRHVGTTVLN